MLSEGRTPQGEPFLSKVHWNAVLFYQTAAFFFSFFFLGGEGGTGCRFGIWSVIDRCSVHYAPVEMIVTLFTSCAAEDESTRRC